MRPTMLSQQIEGRVPGLVDRVLQGARVEDFRVECKADWPPAARAARRIAGHANAARGEPILWIIGLDEDGHRITGTSDVELAEWWPQVTACFDEGMTPRLTPLVVPVGPGQSVVALQMTTERAPYVVKRQDKQGPFEREVPWRDGNRTRSAHRDELLRVLVPAVTPPQATVVKLELRAILRTGTAAEPMTGQPAEPEHVELFLSGDIFFGPPTGPVVVLPAHLMSGQVDLAPDGAGAGESAPLAIPVRFSQRTTWGRPVPTVIDPHPLGVDVRLGDVYITGPGTLAVEGSTRLSIEDREALLQVQRLGVQLNLPVAGGDRPVVVSARLERAAEERGELARWVAV
jgi:hypothetical protein